MFPGFFCFVFLFIQCSHVYGHCAVCFVGKIPNSSIADQGGCLTSAASKQGSSSESGARVGHKQYSLKEKGARDKIETGCETR